MLDRSLGGLDGLATGVLNQAKRNIERFPEDFMFQLTSEEAEALRSRIATSNKVRGGRHHRPYACTEHGAVMLAICVSREYVLATDDRKARKIAESVSIPLITTSEFEFSWAETQRGPHSKDDVRQVLKAIETRGRFSPFRHWKGIRNISPSDGSRYRILKQWAHTRPTHHLDFLGKYSFVTNTYILVYIIHNSRFANIEYNVAMLKPQDIVVILKLLEYPKGERPPLSHMAHELALSASEVHAALGRGQASQLLLPPELGGGPSPKNLEEFLLHGIRYVFPPERGAPTRGLPTAYAAPPLNGLISGGSELPPVWPHPEGETRGIEFKPLYRKVPYAALNDPFLYECLALVDALREGRARDRQIATRELRARLRKGHVRRTKPAPAR